MPQLRFLEPGEVEKLLEVPNLRADTGLRNRVIMQLQWETGMRVGEALALRPRDVIIGEKKVTIQLGKGGKTRVVYWRSDEISMLLERWKRKRPKGEYLFPTVRSENGKGKKVEARSFRTQFARYARQAGLPEWTTPHVLRHAFATNYLKDPEHNIRQLQIILGHAGLSTTERYLHITDQDIAKAMRGY